MIDSSSFSPDEAELIAEALSILAEVDYFSRLADIMSAQLIARFDSIPVAERAIEIERLAATRAALLSLAMEAAKANRARTDSNAKETRDEIPV